ncbi:GyrI-like domain-containing protein [Chloroflexota bacterium]
MVVQGIILKEIPPRTIVYLQCRGSWRQLPEMIERLDRHISQTPLRAIGPASGIYYNTPNEVSIEDLRWEVFYPVPTNTPESSDNTTGVGVRNLPETKMASILHKDSYRKAGSSYGRLEEWVKREGLKKVFGISEEVYISVFGVPNEEQVMEIRIPISST